MLSGHLTALPCPLRCVRIMQEHYPHWTCGFAEPGKEEEQMDVNSALYGQFLSILREELAPALGCTEPIAIAYAAAVAAEKAGRPPRSIHVECSGNIIKNVKSVIVPNSDGMRGIAAAALLGALGGDPAKKLEVLETVRPEHIAQARQMEADGICTVSLAEGRMGLYIRLTLECGAHTAAVTLCGSHTNITELTVDGEPLVRKDFAGQEETDRSGLSLSAILDFAQTAALDDLTPILEPQWRYNLAISQEGLTGEYGAQVGRTLLACSCPDDLFARLRASAAAGSDARMNGCTMPVVINSGSGNQGITVSVPVILYGLSKGLPQETIYRALALSNLTAIYQKAGIGRLSAYCGAVSAAVGAAAGITWLSGGGLREIGMTVVNGLANVSGIVCDGAKASCAAKIAAALEGSLLGHRLAMAGRCFAPGDGIVQPTADETVVTVGRLGRDGMRETDIEILNIMLGH